MTVDGQTHVRHSSAESLSRARARVSRAYTRLIKTKLVPNTKRTKLVLAMAVKPFWVMTQDNNSIQ